MHILYNIMYIHLSINCMSLCIPFESIHDHLTSYIYPFTIRLFYFFNSLIAIILLVDMVALCKIVDSCCLKA